MKNTTQIGLLLLFSFLYAINTNAQVEAHLIDGEGWAKGNLVEIGINQKGVFGAYSQNKPATFHTNREERGNGIFGFIANPLADGWVDYDGGFFTPGSPEEGFTIEINGINYSNNNVDSLFEIPGEITDINMILSDCGEDTAQILWEGNIKGLNIKRYYSIAKEGLFIKMETVIENLSNELKEDVYFMHNVDPDNNVTINGLFDTDMELISQAHTNPDNISLVTASQGSMGTPEDMDGSKISFYANEPNARVTFGGFSNRSASTIWNGDDFDIENKEGSEAAGIDEAISIAFKLENIEPSEAVTFTYYYVLEEIDKTFDPIIVNVSQEHPTTCNGQEGKIILSGLSANESYAISYKHNDEMVSGDVFTSDNDGTLEVLNLSAGRYSDLTVQLNGCETSISAVFELYDPERPSYFLEKTNITNCENVNGQIKVLALSPLTDYTCKYTYNGAAIGPISGTSDANGEMIIDRLERGIYSDFSITKYNNCETLNSEVIEILAPDGPPIYAIPEQFYCDNDDDYITTIDLSDLNDFVLGTDAPSEFEISYHATETDVISNNTLPSTNYKTTGLNSYTLFAKKTSLSDFCYSYIPFTITIKTPITFSLNSETICVNSDGTTNFEYDLPIISTGLSEDLYDFDWFYEGDLIPGENLSNLMADRFGNYSVIVTDKATNCAAMQETTIIPSGPPEVLEIDVISAPFSKNHTVEIIANGYGDYVYAIDNGSYQNSPVFSDISNGLHLFSVRDVNGCGVANIEKTFIGYLNHFSPNNDGYLDYWKINTEDLIDPKIYIFDRKGKLITQLKPNSIGWDGKYHGRIMPTSDYWFKVIYKDNENNIREFRSNFTLKR